MTSKTYSNIDGIIIKHKVTGETFRSKGTEYFSYNTDKFDEVIGTTCNTVEQRDEIVMLINAKKKHISDLLDKYKKKSLRDFTYEESAKIINFLNSLS